MSEDYKELVELIRVEFGYYKDLRNLLRNELRALIENNLDEINRIIPLKEDLILRIQEVKEKREKVMEQLFDNRFENFPDIIRELKSHVNPQMGYELEELYTEAVPVISEIVLLNSRNSLLLRQSLQLTQNLINRIAGFGDAGIYTRHGSEDKNKASTGLLNKQV